MILLFVACQNSTGLKDYDVTWDCGEKVIGSINGKYGYRVNDRCCTKNKATHWKVKTILSRLSFEVVSLERL